MIDKELIKQEIEIRIESMNSCPFKTAELGSEKFDEGELYAYKQILQFIDSLPEEPASEDLEEAMELSVSEEPLLEFFATGQPTIGAYGKDSLRNQFEAGAEWQRKQDQETIELAEDHAMLAGMMKEREEMMENAVECTCGSQATSSFMSNFPNIECGDKVKIIIIKEEQK